MVKFWTIPDTHRVSHNGHGSGGHGKYRVVTRTLCYVSTPYILVTSTGSSAPETADIMLFSLQPSFVFLWPSSSFRK